MLIDAGLAHQARGICDTLATNAIAMIAHRSGQAQLTMPCYSPARSQPKSGLVPVCVCACVCARRVLMSSMPP